MYCFIYYNKLYYQEIKTENVLDNLGCISLTTRQQELECMVPLNTPASSQLPKQPKSLRKQEPIQKPGTHKQLRS